MLNVTPQRIRVAVEYADPLVAIGLNTVLSQQLDMDVVGRAALGDRSNPAPQIVVADYAMGLRLASQPLRQARSRGLPDLRVLVVTGQGREHQVRTALEAGVDGYLELGCEVEELVSGVRQLARGGRYLSAGAAQRIADSMARSALTAREREVLCLVTRGKSNKAIALALGVSQGTVKAHMKALMGKLCAETRTEAANIAVERGLVAAGN
ncbi:MAG TPA: response regulator transcription factor [Roseateles sp.]|nr:response regulator transcription factor [Roseateles sp.]